MTRPKISICIPCYNQGDYLGETLSSCLAQSDDNIEIIVSNNASSDTTAAVINSFTGETRLKTLQQTSTLPMTAHWNTFAKHVTGDWVLLLCADDVLQPHAIATCVHAISHQDNISAAFFEYDYLRYDGVIHKTPFYPHNALIPAAQQFPIFLKGNNFPLSAGLIRRELIDKLGWFNADYSFCSDWHMWLHITAAAPNSAVAYIQDKLFLYRQHDQTETLQCIAKRQTIPEVARMKKYFIDRYVPASEQARYVDAAQLGTKKLALRYAQIATDQGDTKLADHYRTLAAGITADPPSAPLAGPPYPLPDGSQILPDLIL